ncbi:MAG: altronate dehydratase family protein [Bacteroidota bacterium]
MPDVLTAPRALRIHETDTVAVAVEALEAGAEVLGVTLRADVPAGHKIALVPHAEGDAVVKYGFPIGRATEAIAPGEWVHSHNLATRLSGEDEYSYDPVDTDRPAARDVPTWAGYRRPDGRVGTRNELWVLNTVGCVNRAAERIARAVDARFGPEGEGVIDGAHAFAHPYGCSQLGDDLGHTRQLLARLAAHPNAGGVLVLGLGCENNQLDAFLQEADRTDGRVRGFAAQHVLDEVEEGTTLAEEIVGLMRSDQRETVSAADLVLGFKCGGSDGFSGVTANPLVGRVADRVAAWGGRGILTEVPEMFGAERVLMQRATDRGVFERTVDLVNDFKRYFLDHNQPVYENPSPGNKDGGLTTLEEKSLGAIQKGGRAPVAEVVRYTGRASVPGHDGFRPGLALLESPGNDGVSSTALTAAGAALVLFTTGRGTPLGFPAPTVKIATNDAVAARKPHWIDFSAGPLLTGEADLDGLADRFVADLLAIASGRRRTRNETNDYREIAIWKAGVTL